MGMHDQSVDLSLAPPEHSKAGTVFAFAFLTISVMVTVVFVSIAGVKLYEQKDALTTWPMTEGMVSETSFDLTAPGGATPTTSSSGRRYIPIIRHFYTVHGEDFVGTRATPLNSGGTLAWASEFIRDLHYGDPLTVYYNPNDPSESFVVRYWDDTLVLVALFASFFPCFVAFLFTAGGKQKYALKWTLPAMGTGVYALGVAACVGLYFGTVPMQDISQRAWVVFGAGGVMVVVAILLTLVWRNQHIKWRRSEAMTRGA